MSVGDGCLSIGTRTEASTSIGYGAVRNSERPVRGVGPAEGVNRARNGRPMPREVVWLVRVMRMQVAGRMRWVWVRRRVHVGPGGGRYGVVVRNGGWGEHNGVAWQQHVAVLLRLQQD